MINQITEVLVSGAGGLVAGEVGRRLGSKAFDEQADKTSAIINAWSYDQFQKDAQEENANPNQEEISKSDRLSRWVGNMAMSTKKSMEIMIPWSAAAALGVIAIFPASGTAPTAKRANTLNIAADLSGQTANDGTEKIIHNYLFKFNAHQGLAYNVTAAIGGSSETNVSMNSVLYNNKLLPGGSPSMEKTTPIVLNQNNSSHTSSADLFISDNSSLGRESQTINFAKIHGDKINILNVGNNSNPIANQLKTIAQNTGGNYWTGSTPPSLILQKLLSTSKPNKNTHNQEETKLSWAVKGILGAEALALIVAGEKRIQEIRKPVYARLDENNKNKN